MKKGYPGVLNQKCLQTSQQKQKSNLILKYQKMFYQIENVLLDLKCSFLSGLGKAEENSFRSLSLNLKSRRQPQFPAGEQIKKLINLTIRLEAIQHRGVVQKIYKKWDER